MKPKWATQPITMTLQFAELFEIAAALADEIATTIIEEQIMHMLAHGATIEQVAIRYDVPPKHARRIAELARKDARRDHYEQIRDKQVRHDRRSRPSNA